MKDLKEVKVSWNEYKSNNYYDHSLSTHYSVPRKKFNVQNLFRLIVIIINNLA